MPLLKRPGSAVYSYDFKRGRRRFSGSTHCTDLRSAKAVERLAILAAEEEVNAGRDAAPKVMTFMAATARYWAEVGEGTATPKKAEAELHRLAALVGEKTPLREITDDLVAKLVAQRRREYVKGEPARGRISASTVNRTTTQLLRRILTRAKLVWKEKLPDEPNWRVHMLKEPKERVRELRYDEEEKLDAAERADYKAPRIFAQVTGLRRREVAGLRWSQVDFANGTISVVGKGDKPHVLPITDELQDLLVPLQGHHPEAVFTFVAQKNRLCPRTKTRYVKGQRYPVTYEGLGTHFGRTVRKAGIKGFRIHDLRHTAATRTLRATGNLRLVQQMLAHSSPTTTAKYAHATLEDMREGMARATSDGIRRRTAAHGKEHEKEIGNPTD
ncbi:tyrosine-type recombinase/integrase [Methylobacterium marchantiae]|uniref:Tyrosine-type recombinase/integrase n=1 Tax=Methylobacterium marchantiae TaxID=600331 RepID=A0ABW3X1X7_9HYPH|nr:Tyrosine recombinase XerC [Methylobacterium marchantiae]